MTRRSGLAALIATMISGGAAVHELCYSCGEGCTLNQAGADLRRVRGTELWQESAELGVAGV